MAAIAVAPAAPPALSEEQLKQRFVQFAAAAGSAGSINEVDRIFSSVASDPGGLEWLGDVLSDQSLQEITSHVQNFSIGVSYPKKAPATMYLLYKPDRVHLWLSIKGEIDATARATFYGVFNVANLAPGGEVKYNTKEELLSATEIVIQVNNILSLVQFKGPTGDVGKFIGSGTANIPFNDRGKITWRQGD